NIWPSFFRWRRASPPRTDADAALRAAWPQARALDGDSKQVRRVQAVYPRALLIRHRQLRDRPQHRWDAAELVRIVAAGQNAIGAGELDRERQRALVEVDGVVIELAQVGAWLALDVRAAVLERVEAAVQPLGEVRNRSAEMTEGPADAWIAFDDAAEDER